MGKELVWIDEDLVGKVDLIQDICRLKGEELENVINKLKEDDKVMLDCIDDSLIEIKHHAKKVRDEYKKCVDEELEKTYELWEDLNDKLYDSRTKINAYREDTEYLFRTIRDINEKLNDIPFDKIDYALEILNNIKNLTDEDLSILNKLSEINKGE